MRFDAGQLRKTLDEALPRGVDEHPEPRNLYVPARHARALSLENNLVVGIRGAGKSVWWRALQSQQHRHAAAAALSNPALDEISEVAAGFGEKPDPDKYPDKRIIRQILNEGRSPAEIWRAIVAFHTWGRASDAFGALPNWAERVAWIEGNPEPVARAFKTHDDELTEQGQQQLILFDALDRTADKWNDLRRLLRGLLEVVLELRGFRSIRAKAFVRPDMLDDPQVTVFPDASKVLAGKVELRWPRADLYGLLFQRLGNAMKGGAAFRRACEGFGSGGWPESDGVWRVPKALRDGENLQREIFHAMAGPWMGTNRKRGFPYTWLPNHLGDAAEQVSPRSFLWALRTAVEEPVPGNWLHALHSDGIRRGVQEASRIRVDEVREDFFWVPTVMDPLRGLAVPCPFSEISKRWKRADVLSKLTADNSSGLLPKRMEQGHAGLRDDLLDLALFSRQKDGRINMPDVYRVGFGLGRRGGVKPIR